MAFAAADIMARWL